MTKSDNDLNPHFFTAYVGLGSNLEQPETQIYSAINALANIPKSELLNTSHWYRSKAMGPGEQPDYINAAATLKTQLSPIELLHQLQEIENSHGRQRNIRWGARTLDLDLLLYDNIQLDSDELQLPHPEIMNRNFVLYPLYDIAPDLRLVGENTLRQIIHNTDMNDLHRINSHTINIPLTGQTLKETNLPNKPEEQL